MCVCVFVCVCVYVLLCTQLNTNIFDVAQDVRKRDVAQEVRKSGGMDEELEEVGEEVTEVVQKLVPAVAFWEATAGPPHPLPPPVPLRRLTLFLLPFLQQTLGHIQHTCEALSAAHIDAHHQCWRLIHGELAQLASPDWKFLCISGEKCLQTIWDEIPLEIEGLQYLNITQAANGIAGLPPIGNQAGVFCILDYKRLLDITDQYLIRAKSTAENQYASLRSAFSDAIHRH